MKCLFIITLLLCAAVESVGSTREVSLTVDGTPVEMRPRPALRDGHVFVPVSVFRKIGFTVDDRTPGEAIVAWPDSDGIWDFAVGRNWVSGPAKGDKITIPAAPYLQDGVLMVPLRAVFDDPYERPEWDNKTKTVNIRRS